jgi:GNAT superfamily N-acetyltransferase
MAKDIPIVDVTADNVDQTTFFCLQSKPQNPGYLLKRKWLAERFKEGLRIRMLGERQKKRWVGERGFVETIPGEHAWRAVEASDYLFIHCLWVVGKSRGQGRGRRLLELCLDDAKKGHFAGIATVAAENGFSAGRAFFERHGFEAAAGCDPRISLMVYRLKKRAKPPTFSSGAIRGPGHYKKGMTIIRTDQCPYVEDSTRIIVEEGEKLGIAPIKVVPLKTAADVRRRAPSPFGVFATVLDGQLLSYRYLTPRELHKAVAKVRG